MEGFDLEILRRISLYLFLVVGLVIADGYSISVGVASGGEKTIVGNGDKIKVDYTISLTDGTVFDKSKEGKPLEFTVGSGQMISGLDTAVKGMKLNEEKKVTIKPEDAYGIRDESLIMKFERSNLPKDFEPKKGLAIQITGHSGQPMQATIIDINDEEMIVDANNSLAGKVLVFDIKIVGIE